MKVGVIKSASTTKVLINFACVTQHTQHVHKDTNINDCYCQNNATSIRMQRLVWYQPFVCSDWKSSVK